MKKYLLLYRKHIFINFINTAAITIANSLNSFLLQQPDNIILIKIRIINLIIVRFIIAASNF